MQVSVRRNDLAHLITLSLCILNNKIIIIPKLTALFFLFLLCGPHYDTVKLFMPQEIYIIPIYSIIKLWKLASAYWQYCVELISSFTVKSKLEKKIVQSCRQFYMAQVTSQLNSAVSSLLQWIFKTCRVKLEVTNSESHVTGAQCVCLEAQNSAV